jgi:arginine-tRNA-protein transferase
MNANLNNIDLYLTETHACGYLSNNVARSLFIDKSIINQLLYQNLLENGFRRSGNFVYQPCCDDCNACTSIRIPIQDFIPSRTQRRCWKRMVENLHVIRLKPTFHIEHFNIYQRYIATRHADGGMVNPTPDDYMKFLSTTCCPSMFVEFRYHKQAFAVAVTDILPNALSAVYTFFDPDYAHYSPGVLAILWQIEEARQRGLKYLYLGYWIENCQKMRYKNQYRPLQAWNGKKWHEFKYDEPLILPTCVS